VKLNKLKPIAPIKLEVVDGLRKAKIAKTKAENETIVSNGFFL